MRIAIVGACPSSRLLAPFNDPNWQTWGFSPNSAGKLPPTTHWFEIHGDLGMSHNGLDKDDEAKYINWIKMLPCKVYVQQIELFHNAEKFPAEELVQEFGPYWFTSTISWLMAFALTQGVTELGIWGCDLSLIKEYSYQMPAVHRFMELYTERNIPIYVPPESELLNPPALYAYSETSPMGRKLNIRKVEIENRIMEIDAKIKELANNRLHLVGALDDNEYTRARWLNPFSERK